jgi:AraC family ethanolamine operon transcriptional activator
MQIILDSTFHTLEEFMQEVDRWDIDFRLLGRGGFLGRVKQLVSRDVLITYARLQRSLDQAGATPPGYRTFVILAEGCRGFWWRGHQVTSNDLLVFPPSNELQSASGEDFGVFTVSVRTAYLDQLDKNLGLRGFADRKQEVVPIDSRAMLDLRSTAGMIVKSGCGPVAVAAAQRLAEKLAVYTANDTSGYKSNLRKRDQAVDRIIEYVHSVPVPASSLDTLCGIAKTSERTLQYAFKERYGISPSAYIKRWKLNTARRCLLQSNSSDVTIQDIAMSLGFFHLGQFSAEYKDLFAELPSTTLNSNN